MLLMRRGRSLLRGGGRLLSWRVDREADEDEVILGATNACVGETPWCESGPAG